MTEMNPAIRCQRCPPEDNIISEYKVRETNIETGEIIHFRYLCSVHVELDYGPWLTKRHRAAMASQ